MPLTIELWWNVWRLAKVWGHQSLKEWLGRLKMYATRFTTTLTMLAKRSVSLEYLKEVSLQELLWSSVPTWKYTHFTLLDHLIRECLSILYALIGGVMSWTYSLVILLRLHSFKVGLLQQTITALGGTSPNTTNHQLSCPSLTMRTKVSQRLTKGESKVSRTLASGSGIKTKL